MSKSLVDPDVAHIRFQTYRLLESRFQPDKGRLVRFELFDNAAVCLYKRTADFLYTSCGFYEVRFSMFLHLHVSKIHLFTVFFLVIDADGHLHSIY